MSEPFVVIAVNQDDCGIGKVIVVDTFEHAKQSALELVKELGIDEDTDEQILSDLEEYFEYGDGWVVNITQAE